MSGGTSIPFSRDITGRVYDVCFPCSELPTLMYMQHHLYLSLSLAILRVLGSGDDLRDGDRNCQEEPVCALVEDRGVEKGGQTGSHANPNMREADIQQVRTPGGSTLPTMWLLG